MVVRSQVMTGSAAATERGATPLHRVLGTLGMLGSPFLFLSVAANGFQQGGSNRLGAALGLVFVVGWFSSVLGLRALGAAGGRLPGTILLGLELVGVALAGLFQIYEFVAPGSDSLLYTVTDLAWPLSMLTPLIAALWLPLGIVEPGTIGVPAGLVIGGVHTMIGWFLLGYAVRNGGTPAARG